MIVKTITYVDTNGEERTEDFYFHLFTHEIARLQAKLGYTDLNEGIKAITQKGTLESILNLLEDIILGAYGQKTEDGKSFIKDYIEREKFEYSQAYAELFQELLENPDKMVEFAEGIATAKKPTSNKVKLEHKK